MTVQELIRALSTQDPAATVTVGGEPAHDLVLTNSDASQVAIPVGVAAKPA